MHDKHIRGTGKSYLLTSVYLWCIVKSIKVLAGAPTGIAAANIEVPNTDIGAVTLHNMLDLDHNCKTKLDLSNMEHAKVAALHKMVVLMNDEVSMVDVDLWQSLEEVLSVVDHNKRPKVIAHDAYGAAHVILFGDFKQLPPATSRPPFITAPSVLDAFDFRVLRENRRVVADGSRAEELELFHRVLHDISNGIASNDVRQFIVDAYVRGAQCGCASNCELEGSTAIFTKRRYRNAWNRVIVRSLAAKHGHSLKIKARVRARGSEQYYGERRTKWIRSRARSQSLWSLHLAGDFHESFETVATRAQPHMMRCMLTSNLAVDQRFANGTQGRLLYWSPSHVESKKALPSTDGRLMARFVKESSLKSRSQLLPDIDFMDVQPRAENLACSGEPLLIQMPFGPCYAITVHKSQSLSVKHIVRGCCEGIFAHGHLYVLISRATDPKNVQLVGLPPKDMMEEVEAAWARAGLNVDECWRRAVSVTNEWVYTPGTGPVGNRIT